ncbi:MAG: AMP-binding protein, partial [Actinobacteria bacterium]|nr:AMP-binding protein [Actinomycetota bacterium]
MARSEARGSTDIPLLDETIGANFESTVARFPDREALVARHQHERFTYAELNDAVDVVARGLLDLGIAKGDRVGIWSPNTYEWVLVQYATAKIGAILVNINPAYRTSEVQYALKQSGCRLLIAAPSFKTSDYKAMIEEVRPDLPELETVILLESPEWDALLAAASNVALERLREVSASL